MSVVVAAVAVDIVCQTIRTVKCEKKKETRTKRTKVHIILLFGAHTIPAIQHSCVASIKHLSFLFYSDSFHLNKIVCDFSLKFKVIMAGGAADRKLM